VTEDVTPSVVELSIDNLVQVEVGGGNRVRQDIKSLV